MSLHLSMRQRAMLEEMGVRVWWPAEALAASEPTTTPLTKPTNPIAIPAPAPVSVSVPHRAAAATPPPLVTGASPVLVLHPPQALYPDADPQKIPPKLGNAWLIVVEGEPGADPLVGDAGVLLNNMLRALGLHRHPRVFLSVVAPQNPDAPPNPSPVQALADAVAHVQPSMVLVMGRMAARAVLGRSDPLGQLRAQPHTVAGRCAIVTYESRYLLRALPQNKAAAWADLCRALALVQVRAPI